MKRIVLDNGSQSSGEDTGRQPGTLPSSASGTSDISHSTRERQQQRHVLPPELIEILAPSLKFGVATGTLGLFTGAVAGIVRTSTPVLFSVASGAQWFSLGSSYYASRMVIEKAWGGRDQLTNADKTKSSAIAGGFAGMIGGLIRGPKNVAPGILAFTLLGAGGQAVANSIAPNTWETTKTRFLSSKWSPVTPLSDQEYEEFLEEKLLKVEAEIALLDDNIRALQSQGALGSPEGSRKQ
ncbi:hypothetical protein QBC33DRAFT_535419 [Phialemonium atrogriseum]|uniref:Uncharacterized protein n=1 Tax=Phialemonium atrogriseum TaxID=1093897 RepID=A0AAJ0FPX0_9PEZI|nr:uncharacterized protein QBC33DRAFT_535419 [Phialemonium atrogriseum]KAK1768570.1 hypothetical protein QBC33DRAFT_535419 [Phialemonium atrogriseum]